MTIEQSDQEIEELIALSRERIERGSKSFALAARLFEPFVRDSAYMLYAWCRYCDDRVDGQSMGFRAQYRSEPGRALAAVEELERATERAFRGEAVEAVFQALAVVTARHEIPRRYPRDLISGFRMDAEQRRYRTLEDTLDYCYHVAGAVGVMMAYVMGARDRAILERACDLGIAFQLTNIARDVAADHAMGRVYLPDEWLDEAGLTHVTMCEPSNRAALFAVTRRLLEAAEPYYDSANVGLSHLPWRSAWAVGAAQSVYRAIGLQVLRLGPAAWDQRVHTGKLAKGGALLVGLQRSISSRGGGNEAALVAPRDGLWTMRDL